MAPKTSEQWYKVSQIIIGTANLIMMLLGIIGVWFRVSADLDVAKNDIKEMKASITLLAGAQSAALERLTRTETKVDLLFQRRQQDGQGRDGGP